jgi:hypothetical protein
MQQQHHLQNRTTSSIFALFIEIIITGNCGKKKEGQKDLNA